MNNPRSIYESKIQNEADLPLLGGGKINKVYCEDTQRTFTYSTNGETVSVPNVYATLD